MSDRMGEIKQRLENATPGPWVVETRSFAHHNNPYACAAVETYRRVVTKNVFPICVLNLKSPPADCDFHNFELIAHAPSDLAWLIAEVERLERTHSLSAAVSVRKERDALAVRCNQFNDQVNRLSAENERLRAALKFYAEPMSIEPFLSEAKAPKTFGRPCISMDFYKVARKALEDS